MAFRGTAALALRATEALGFRASGVTLAKQIQDPNMPTQIILRSLERDGAQPSTELWQRVQSEPSIKSKVRLKTMLKWLKERQRVITRPSDSTDRKAPYVYMLGKKPMIVPLNGAPELSKADEGENQA